MEYEIEGSKVRFSPSPQAKKITNRYFDSSQTQMVVWDQWTRYCSNPKGSQCETNKST